MTANASNTDNQEIDLSVISQKINSAYQSFLQFFESNEQQNRFLCDLVFNFFVE